MLALHREKAPLIWSGELQLVRHHALPPAQAAAPAMLVTEGARGVVRRHPAWASVATRLEGLEAVPLAGCLHEEEVVG